MRLLLVSGSTRAASTNTAAVRTALDVVPEGMTAALYDGLGALPAFNPDDDFEPLPPAVAALRRALAEADAVLFCTPEYAGTLPGSFKNLLDWTVGCTDIYGKPVAWLNVAAEGRGRGADETLRTVLGYVGAKPIDAACVRVTLAREAIGADGTVVDEAFRSRLVEVLGTIGRSIGAQDG